MLMMSYCAVIRTDHDQTRELDDPMSLVNYL